MGELIISGERDRTVRRVRPDRGTYHAGRPDPPPSCPSCGKPLEETGPTRTGLIGVCRRESCPGWVVIFTRAEAGGALVVAERVARTAPAAPPCPPRPPGR